jgi:hypothetical protein
MLEFAVWFVTGALVPLSLRAGVYGMAMPIGGERWTSTLSPLLASPANRVALLLGRAMLQILAVRRGKPNPREVPFELAVKCPRPATR